jgi:hypothetical protein
MNDIAFEIETAAECLFESGEENFEEVAKEIVSRYPGVSWSSVRLCLEYQVDDLKKLERVVRDLIEFSRAEPDKPAKEARGWPPS